MPSTDPPLLCFLFCADVAELTFGWTANTGSHVSLFTQFLFSKVFPSIFSYSFFFMCCMCFFNVSTNVFPIIFLKKFPCCSLLFFSQCCIGQLVGVLSRPQIYGKLARPAGTRHKHPIRIHPTPLRIHLHSCNENENKIKFRNFSHNAEQRTCKIPIQSENYHELLHISKVS